LRQCVDRRDGVLQTLQARGLDPAEALVEIPLEALNADAGEAGVHQLLARSGQRPTAMFCANDFAALGALRALREVGLAVPEDMAAVGYDDVMFAGMLATPLTSVRQPMHALGWSAADILLTRPPDDATARQAAFEPEPVVRGSSSRWAAPPGAARRGEPRAPSRLRPWRGPPRPGRAAAAVSRGPG